MGAIVLQAWPELVWGWERTKAAPPWLQLNTIRPQPAGLGLLAHCVQRNIGDLRDPACLPRLQPLLQLQPRPERVCVPKGPVQPSQLFRLVMEKKNSPDSVTWEESRRFGDIFSLTHHLTK